jgi:hypothetical protein
MASVAVAGFTRHKAARDLAPALRRLKLTFGYGFDQPAKEQFG